MNAIEAPNSIKRFANHLVYIIGIPVFAMLFAILYGPTFNQEPAVVQLWTDDTPLCIPIVCAIIFGVLLISRIILCSVAKHTAVSQFQYLCWQIVEFIVASLFCAMFLSLHFERIFFDLLPIVLLYGALILVMPYFGLWQWVLAKDRDHRLQEAEKSVEELKQGHNKLETGSIKFCDERGSVKLVVAADRIIYLESAGNYVNVVYANNGSVVRFALRNSLKGVEDSCLSSGLLRCHRSFFINLRKVKLLRKDGDALYAEIDYPGVDRIPVSKSYAGEVMRYFSSQTKD